MQEGQGWSERTLELPHHIPGPGSQTRDPYRTSGSLCPMNHGGYHLLPHPHCLGNTSTWGGASLQPLQKRARRRPSLTLQSHKEPR